MIRKSAVTGLTESLARQRFDEARTLDGAVVEMMEQDDGLWTVTIVFDDQGGELGFEDLTAFDEVQGQVPAVAAAAATAAPSIQWLGGLSQRFESNGKSGAIGFDKKGGFSYGAYQIATRTGTMKSFLTFLAKRFAVLSAPLVTAGGNDAATAGLATFTAAWRSLAADPEFLNAQHAFIGESHYLPFAKALRQPPLTLEVDARSAVLRDVVWSVAVQHGPGNQVFRNALDGKDVAAMIDRQITQAVYEERSNVAKYFPTSTPKIQQALKSRFREELALALNRLAAS